MKATIQQLKDDIFKLHDVQVRPQVANAHLKIAESDTNN